MNTQELHEALEASLVQQVFVPEDQRMRLPPAAIEAICENIRHHIVAIHTCFADLRAHQPLDGALEVSLAHLQYNLFHIGAYARELKRGAKNGD